MARYFTTEHSHPYPWEQVAQAVFQRYPNPFATHVLSEDTLHREIIDDNVLYTRRVLTKTNKVPSWGERWIKGLVRRVPLVEESYVDSASRSITMYTRSIGYTSFMVAVEKITFQPCPQEPGHTVALKQGWVESNFYGLRSAIKNFGMESFKRNITRSTQGFNHVLERLTEREQELRLVAGVKLAEFTHKKDLLRERGMETVESSLAELSLRKDQLKERSLEKVMGLRSASSQQWECAKARAERVRLRALEVARERAEGVLRGTQLQAETQQPAEQELE